VSAATGDASGSGQVDAPIVVRFGDSDFASKYQTLIEDIGQWRATTGRVESIDLRFGGEAVVNPDTTVAPKPVAQHASKPAKSRTRAQATKHSR